MATLAQLANPLFVTRKLREYGPYNIARTIAKKTKSERLYVAEREAETRWLRFRNATEVAARRAAAKRAVDATPQWRGFLPKDKGFKLVTPGTIPGLAEIRDYCAAVYHARKDEARASGQVYTSLLAPSVDSVASGIVADLTRHRMLQDFATGPHMTAIVADYLGEIPVIKDITLSVTHPNDKVEGSQRFHCDYSTRPHIKFYLAVEDIAEDCGPLTWITAEQTKRLAADEDYYFGRMEDDRVEAAVAPPSWHKLVGPAGTAALLDTSRCLHFGSRHNIRDRVHFILFYDLLYAWGGMPVPTSHVFAEDTREVPRMLLTT